MDALSIIAANQELHLWQSPTGTNKETLYSYLSGLYSRKLIKEHSVASVLEIGYANGSSLVLWSHAFPKASIVGVDKYICTNPHPALKSLGNISIQQADAFSQEFIGSLSEKYDVIIVAGPNTVASQIVALKSYSEFLNSDGLLIIENVSNGLPSARLIRQNCSKEIRKNLVHYDFRKTRNHSDNCLIVYFENVEEAKREKKQQNFWGVISFISPVNLPSEINVYYYIRKIYYGVRYRILKVYGKL